MCSTSWTPAVPEPKGTGDSFENLPGAAELGGQSSGLFKCCWRPNMGPCQWSSWKNGKESKKEREKRERQTQRESKRGYFYKKYKSMQLRKHRNDSLGGNDGGEGWRGAQSDRRGQITEHWRVGERKQVHNCIKYTRSGKWSHNSISTEYGRIQQEVSASHESLNYKERSGKCMLSDVFVVQTQRALTQTWTAQVPTHLGCVT